MIGISWLRTFRHQKQRKTKEFGISKPVQLLVVPVILVSLWLHEFILFYFFVTQPRGLGPKRGHTHMRKKPTQVEKYGVPRARTLGTHMRTAPLTSEVSSRSPMLAWVEVHKRGQGFEYGYTLLIKNSWWWSSRFIESLEDWMRILTITFQSKEAITHNHNWKETKCESHTPSLNQQKQ